MANKVRSFNPVWNLRDLTGLPLDDTYYVFFLENQIPFIPTNVFNDPSGTVILPNPLQVSAAGTIGPDLFFTPHQVLRIEIRRGPTQSDELVWLIENYVPDGDEGPLPGTSIETDNQITNAQFSVIEFSSPLQVNGLSNTSVEIAPGWTIAVTGTGNLTVERIELTSDDQVPTNAPYGLLINTTGFTSAVLIQQFNENGTIWSNQAVATSLTARTVDGNPHTLNVSLTNNAPVALALPIASHTLTSAWQEFRGAVDVPESTNDEEPADAWTRLNVTLPGTGVIGITSLQLMGQSFPLQVPYEQESIARQQDHLFHYYRESLLMQPKSSVLTGFNWSLNPWQAFPASGSTVSSQTAYTADQTILHQQTGGSKVAVNRGVAADNFSFQIVAVTSDNRFAAIEYIDRSTIRPYWGAKMSALLKAKIVTGHSSSIRFKMRLIHRATLPSTIGAAEPIASWTGDGNPTFSAGWTAISPKNDPVYTLDTDYQVFPFNEFILPAASSANMTLGIVIYTLDEMDETATADRIEFERCSLVPNEFAIDANVLTFDENLRRCQYYYEKSNRLADLPGTINADGARLELMQLSRVTSFENVYLKSFTLPFTQSKRTETPAFRFWPVQGSSVVNTVTIAGYRNGAPVTVSSGASIANIAISGHFAPLNASRERLLVLAELTDTAALSYTVSVANEHDEGILMYQYECDARLGL